MFGLNFSGGQATADVIARIERDVGLIGRDELMDLLEVARLQKPAGYDQHQRDIAQLHQGKQEAITRRAIQRRYPSTARKYDTLPVNVTRTKANLEAQAYRQPIERWLTVNGERPGARGEDGVVLEDEIPRQDALREAIKRARLSVVLPELERRTMTSLTHFARMRPLVPGHDRSAASIEMRLFWPYQVRVIEDPEYRGHFWAAKHIMASIGTNLRARGNPRIWEVCSLLGDERVEGGIRYRYGITHIDEAGNVLKRHIHAGSRHPWLVMHKGEPQGSLWLDEDRDQVRVQENLNVTISQWMMREDYQNHRKAWAAGDLAKMKGTKLSGGPGSFTTFPEGTQVGEFGATLDETTLRNLESVMKLLGNSWQQNPDQWATKPGQPLSGTSRLVRNEPALQKRREHVDTFTAWEETALLPLLAEQADLWLHPNGATQRRILGDGVKLHAKFPEPPQYEEPEAKRLRYSNMMRDGWISPAEAAVKGGAGYQTVEEAIAAGVSAEIMEPTSEAPASRARVPGSEAPPLQQEGVADAEE